MLYLATKKLQPIGRRSVVNKGVVRNEEATLSQQLSDTSPQSGRGPLGAKEKAARHAKTRSSNYGKREVDQAATTYQPQARSGPMSATPYRTVPNQLREVRWWGYQLVGLVNGGDRMILPFTSTAGRLLHTRSETLVAVGETAKTYRKGRT